MPAWPSTLPAPKIEGYNVKPEAGFIRTDMEAGPARQRKRFTVVPQKLEASWRFTSAQMATFKTFFKTTINLGTDWFTMTLDIGDGLISYNVRFTAPHVDAIKSGMNWDVNGQIEVSV